MHEKEQRDLMSAVSARSISHATGVDLVRMNNNYWSASSNSGWSKIAPQR
jgi:hypothetical protein